LLGAVVPSRITGALKLMLGMFAGPWKLGGSPAGRGGRDGFAWMVPGAMPTPGGAMPGAPGDVSRGLTAAGGAIPAVPGGMPVPGGGAPG
jgi:hypothetical protein